MKIIESLKENIAKITKDRVMVMILTSVFVSGIVFTVSMLSKTRTYNGMIYARWTAFGLQHLYYDKWTFTLVLAALGVVISILHTALVAKIYLISTKRMAAFFAVFSAIVVMLGIMIISRVIGEIPN